MIPELTMFAAYNNLTTAIYENLMQLEIDIPFSLDKVSEHFLYNVLTLSMLGKNFLLSGKNKIAIFFLFFPENKIWHFMQIAI